MTKAKSSDLQTRQGERGEELCDQALAEILPQDEAVGRKQWEPFRQEAQEAFEKEEKKSIPLVDIPILALALVTLDKRTLARLIEAIAADLNARKEKEVLAAYRRLLPMVRALFYAFGYYKLYPMERELAVRREVRSTLDEVFQLKRLGLFWLDILVRLGMVGSSVAAEIRSGRGVMDDAMDLQRIGELLTQFLPLLLPLAQARQDDGLCLTAENVDRMVFLGTFIPEKVREVEHSDNYLGVDWRAQVIGLFALLRQTYDPIRCAALYYFDSRKMSRESAEVASIWALGRPTSRPKSSSRTKVKENTGPGDGAEAVRETEIPTDVREEVGSDNS